MEGAESKETITGIPLSSFEVASILSPDPAKRELYLKPCAGPLGNLILEFRLLVSNKVENNSSIFLSTIKLLCCICAGVYIGFLINNFMKTGEEIDWQYGYGKAFILIALILWCIIYYNWLQTLVAPLFFSIGNSKLYFNYKRYFKTILLGALVILVAAFIIYDTSGYRRRLISVVGILFFLLASISFSKHPEYIRWDTMISGIVLQIILGIMTIRWDTGRNIIEGVANNIITFLDYGHEGAVFVYGTFLIDEKLVFAFQALSTLYFLAMITRILFYLGWLQRFCFKLGGFIEFCLGTTVIESVYAASVIFLGMSEAPLLCAAYIELLTPSEIHAMMAAGHATVAGTLFAAYTTLGIDPRYVVTASTMAAPASLCFSKLLYPENTPSKTSSDSIEMLSSEDSSIVDAACKGASSAVFMVQGIIASVIACISLIAFANGLCSWLGFLIGIEGLTLEYLVGQLFVPIAWLMGVIPEECEAVGSLIGIKTIANEFVAYQQLGVLKKQGKISVRSEAIATFALCGFANPGALGTNIATLVALAKGRSECINKVAVRAFITGCITSFTSACIAGLLTQEEGIRIGS